MSSDSSSTERRELPTEIKVKTMKRLFISFPTEFRGMTVLLMEAGGSIRLFVYPHVLRLFHGMAELIL